MKWDCKDFIGIFPEVYPSGFCDHLIKEFNSNQSLGAGSDRLAIGKDKHEADDFHIFANALIMDLHQFQEKDTTGMFFQGLQQCFETYTNEFSVMKDTYLGCKNIKLQKTSKGGGYHLWHGEQGNGGQQGNRGLVYMLYLNTLPQEANGETEFLYQQRRINPVGNTMVLWPAAFTHAHRGNPVYGDNTKYIVTGWFYYE
tara:strand:+ start:277 stop:873 length:597 start_codon:yes stop_codon:yes gene_type:complete